MQLALLGLEEVLIAARHAPPVRSRAVSLCLGYLATKAGHERWPFDRFWKAMAEQDEKLRSANLNSTLNAIYLRVGVERSYCCEPVMRHRRGKAKQGDDNVRP